MEWLVLWVLCGVACAMIAKNKGKDGCGWFLLGVLFGPFGILFALISTPNAEKVEERAIDRGAMKKCPYCAELIKKEAIKCRYCGEAVEAQEDEPSHFELLPPATPAKWQGWRLGLAIIAVIAIVQIGLLISGQNSGPPTSTRQIEAETQTARRATDSLARLTDSIRASTREREERRRARIKSRPVRDAAYAARQPYWGSLSTKVYYANSPECDGLDAFNPSKDLQFFQTRDEAERAGYEPATEEGCVEPALDLEPR